MNTVRRAAATAVLLSAVLLAVGCASTSPVVRFGPDSPMGLLVVTMPKTAYVHSADFREVDLRAGRFQEGVTTLEASAWSGDAINSGGELYLAVRAVKPGDYLMQGLFTARGVAGFGGCAAEGGPVYPVEAGRITIVRADLYWRAFLAEGFVPDVDDQAVLDTFNAARAAGGHDIRGPVSIVEPAARIRWPSPLSWTRDCVRTATFTRIE
ncbi:hypothetical protein [Brevundimonas sp.]|uniref:hypothetical protein n=1 Tax=Brevundimonas sp. TaxID=1871086 RepID=UPI002FCC1210